MTRDAAVQQARERVERLRESLHATYNGGHHEEPAYSAFHQGMDTVCNVLGNGGALDAYALDRLAQELGELAKEMCRYTLRDLTCIALSTASGGVLRLKSAADWHPSGRYGRSNCEQVDCFNTG